MGTEPAFEHKPGSSVPTPRAPNASTDANRIQGRAPTRVASGPVPPATSPRAAAPSHPATRDFADRRRSKLGTMMHGAELHDPGSEKLRLTAGKVVPGTRYRIIRWLGEGGMGVVYEAEHVDIERRVALKILRFDLSQQSRMVQVFKDEARAAGKLGSKHVVEIYDFGELADGRLFFAMELLDGTDLVIEDEGDTFDVAQTIGILRQVCKGLLVAHRNGVVHRDVKPDNIIMTTSHDGDRQMVKIVDFGISAMLAAGSGSGGGIAGTPHYMAPEQILGEAFDGRLDIYALGCTAFEMLTGQPPFDAPTVEDLLAKQLRDPPPRLGSLRPDVPPAVDEVIARCLRKDPADRYPDMAELEAALCEAQIAAALRTAWDDLPPPDIADVERRERIRQKMPSVEGYGRKRGMVWPFVAAASSLVAVGLAAFLLFGRGPTDEDKVLVDGITNDARASAARMEFVPGALAKIEELETLEGSAARLGDERGEDLRGEFAQSLSGLGDKLWDQGNSVLASHYYLQSLAFEPEQPELVDRLGLSPFLLADAMRRLRSGELSEEELYLAKLAEAEVTEDPAQKAEIMQEAEALVEELDEQSMIRVAAATGRGKGTKVARNDEPKPADPVEAAPAPDPIELVEDFEEALEEAALDPEDVVGETPAEVEKKKDKKKRRPKASGPDPGYALGTAERDPEQAKALAEQGQQALKSGQRAEAAKLFNQAIAFDNRNAEALMGLSDVYFDTGQDRKAIVYAERAVRASPSNETYRLKLGDAYFKALLYTDALKQYQEAKKRGSSRADDRIARVQDKVGK